MKRDGGERTEWAGEVRASVLLHRGLTQRIIGAAIEVHSRLGPGLLESVYEACLCHELERAGLAFERQVHVPLRYRDAALDLGFRADVIVDNAVLLELKAISDVLPVHEAQLLSYLRLTGLRVGLLLNFHVPTLKDGIIRRVL